MSRLADRYDPARNSFGLIRLLLAVGVLVAHAWPLGYAQPSLGWAASAGQSELGSLSVQGFFVISGFLVTGSALTHSVVRFSWHRALRIFPGLWVCLLVTAFVVAPLVALYENRTLRGFWTHPEGPFAYLTTNWFASMEQYPIAGLLSSTPFGQLMGGPSAFDGSLWSLRYELVCYVLIGILSATAVVRRAPRALLVILLIGYLLIVRDLVTAPGWAVRPVAVGAVGPFPLIGSFSSEWLLYLTFLFVLGAAARRYMHRIPMDGRLAVLAATLLVSSLLMGGFIVVGLPAYAYLLIYLGVALPGWLSRIGRERDYSYGVYIYAFPVQQVLALVGVAEYGMPVYLALSVLGTLLFAVPSWHLVEKPAMRLRGIDSGRMTPAAPMPAAALRS
ncbi:acyltransferase family protein [Micromonospora sp. LOL_023]|uniref:acyltransferase family protein n=1 Tax=Micromonospora sp. LOL_023 TaxID=3345418 RepID=UPI003A85133A